MNGDMVKHLTRQKNIYKRSPVEFDTNLLQNVCCNALYGWICIYIFCFIVNSSFPLSLGHIHCHKVGGSVIKAKCDGGPNGWAMSFLVYGPPSIDNLSFIFFFFFYLKTISHLFLQQVFIYFTDICVNNNEYKAQNKTKCLKCFFSRGW